MANNAKTKPQVNCPRFFMKRGYGQGYRVKRSRRAGFVASAIDCPFGDGGKRIIFA